MRKLLIGFVLGMASAATATALAISGGQSLKLQPGDTAYITDVARPGEPTCQAVVKRGIPTLSCFVDSAGGEL